MTVLSTAELDAILAQLDRAAAERERHTTDLRRERLISSTDLDALLWEHGIGSEEPSSSETNNVVQSGTSNVLQPTAAERTNNVGQQGTTNVSFPLGVEDLAEERKSSQPQLAHDDSETQAAENESTPSNVVTTMVSERSDEEVRLAWEARAKKLAHPKRRPKDDEPRKNGTDERFPRPDACMWPDLYRGELWSEYMKRIGRYLVGMAHKLRYETNAVGSDLEDLLRQRAWDDAAGAVVLDFYDETKGIELSGTKLVKVKITDEAGTRYQSREEATASGYIPLRMFNAWITNAVEQHEKTYDPIYRQKRSEWGRRGGQQGRRGPKHTDAEILALADLSEADAAKKLKCSVKTIQRRRREIASRQDDS